MIFSRYTIASWLTGTVLCLAIGAAAPQGQAEPPTIHLLAPQDNVCGAFDPLVAETALRLVNAELAATYGAPSRYWAVDQLAKLPDDAFPQVKVTLEPLPRMRRLRLTRRDGVFIASASDDGNEFVRCARMTADLPDTAVVGVYVSGHEVGAKAVFSKVTLNGAAPTDAPQVVGLGGGPGKTIVETDGPQWTLRAPDHGDGDLMAGVTVTGNFEFEAVVDAPTDLSGVRIGLLCCPLQPTEGDAVGAVLAKTRPAGMVREAATGTAWPLWDLSAHTLVARVIPSLDKKSRIVGRTTASSATWDQLVGSVTVSYTHLTLPTN